LKTPLIFGALLVCVVIKGTLHEIASRALSPVAKLGGVVLLENVEILDLTPNICVPSPSYSLLVCFVNGIWTFQESFILRARSQYSNAIGQHGGSGYAIRQDSTIRNGGLHKNEMTQRHYMLGKGFARIVPSYVPLNRLSHFRSAQFHIYECDPCALIVSRSRDAGIKRRLTLPITSVEGLLGIVSNPLVLEDHILGGLSYLVSGSGHIRHFLGLFLGGLGQSVRVSGAGFHFMPLESYEQAGKQVNADNYHCPPESRSLVATQFFLYLLEIVGGLWLCCVWGVERLGTLDFRTTVQGFVGLFVGGIFAVHGGVSVTQKLLTPMNYCNTVLAIGRAQMANVLSTEKQIAVIGGLVEGSSIRSIERITGIHRDTIMRLGVRVGQGCAKLLDAKMRNLPCRQLQFDEIWGFIGKKERHCTPDDSLELGDVWTFCAIDADTKIVPSFKCGKRDLATANAFVSDVASRMRNRVQISSDALRAYVDAIEMTFGADVDFAQIIKTYVTDDSHIPERRFSAPEIVITEKKSVSGFPDLRLASTSHVERLNGTTRLHMRRLTRLTYAFSKKLENFNAAVALHFAYYNFVKRHITLRATPAMAAGIERNFWTVGNLVEATV
jgi:IS1 family transposase